MSKTFEVLILVVYLAMVFTLVRPGSQGPELVKNIGDAVSSLIGSATGGGSWATPASSGVGSVVYA